MAGCKYKYYVFDAYGTLFDVHSAVAKFAGEIGDSADRLSQIWRTKHLEYSWIYGRLGIKKSFWQLTGDSLDYAIASTGGLADEALRDKLLNAYWTLDA
ncbi:MAG TPA: haloacid dehalogenase type II, partial [Rhizobiales bacterium]|nr:haloacid dehalogenase type II [Hyphomicrobiales bacterium]